MKFFGSFPLVITSSVCLLAQTGSSPGVGSPAPKPRPDATQAKPTGGFPPGQPGVPSADTKPASVDDNKVVLTIGEEKVTAKEFDRLIDALPDQYRTQARGPLKRQMAEQIARVKMLAAEARKRGLDKDALTQSRIRFQEDNLLAGATYSDMMQKVTVDDAALRKYYDEHKNEFETAQARHILIRFKGSQVPLREGKPELTDEQALAKVQELKKQLAGGADFVALAKAESDDVGSGVNGGDLGSFSRGQMVPAFEEVAFRQPVGQVSEPVKTQFGYHLIRVDKREAQPFEGTKEEIAKRLKPEAARKAVEDLQKSAGIVLDDTYFGPAQPAGTPPGVGPAAPPPPAAAPKGGQ